MPSELSKDIIGTKTGAYTYEIGREKLKEFTLAIGEENPLYSDIETAKKYGYSELPVTPTFSTVLSFWGNPKFFDQMGDLGIDIKKLLHLKEDYTYHKPMTIGMVIKVESEVSDVKLGKMNMVTFSSKYFNNDDLMMVGDTTIIILPDAA